MVYLLAVMDLARVGVNKKHAVDDLERALKGKEVAKAQVAIAA